MITHGTRGLVCTSVLDTFLVEMAADRQKILEMML